MNDRVAGRALGELSMKPITSGSLHVRAAILAPPDSRGSSETFADVPCATANVRSGLSGSTAAAVAPLEPDDDGVDEWPRAVFETEAGEHP